MDTKYSMKDVTQITDKSDIEIQLGKQKKKHQSKSSVYFTEDAFKVLEKTIWNKHREYSAKKNVIIESKEWGRIIDGFQELLNLIELQNDKEALLERLFYFDQSERNSYLENEEKNNTEITKMIKDFIHWIEENLKNQSIITITGK